MDDRVWTALADPKRRAVLELLRQRPRTVNDLAAMLPASQPTTSKFLKVLREAGLVTVRPDAQRRVYAVDARRLVALDAWLAPYRALWNERLDALGAQLEEED